MAKIKVIAVANQKGGVGKSTFVYKMKLDAMKKQGKRADLTSRPLGVKLNSVGKMSDEITDSARQIHGFIRLSEAEITDEKLAGITYPPQCKNQPCKRTQKPIFHSRNIGIVKKLIFFGVGFAGNVQSARSLKSTSPSQLRKRRIRKTAAGMRLLLSVVVKNIIIIF